MNDIDVKLRREGVLRGGYIAKKEKAKLDLIIMPFVPEEWHGKLAIMGLLGYAGDAEAGERAIAPFRALAEPIADMKAAITNPRSAAESLMPSTAKTSATPDNASPTAEVV